MYEVNVQRPVAAGRQARRPALLYRLQLVRQQREASRRRPSSQPPATWDELMDQCRKLKKDKVAEFPYVSAWQRQWASLSWSLFSIWYSEGAKVFDEQEQPRRSTRRSRRSSRCIARCTRRAWCSPTSSRSTRKACRASPPASTPTWSCTNTTRRCSTTRSCRRSPARSRTRSCRARRARPSSGPRSTSWARSPIDVDRTWNLMQFFGGKAKDGQYHVIKRWALEFGLGTPYKEVIDDPEVQAASASGRTSRLGQAAGDRDAARRLQDDVVPGVGLVHDGRGAGLYPRPAVARPAHRQAAEESRGGQGAIPTELPASMATLPRHPAARPRDPRAGAMPLIRGPAISRGVTRSGAAASARSSGGRGMRRRSACRRDVAAAVAGTSRPTPAAPAHAADAAGRLPRHRRAARLLAGAQPPPHQRADQALGVRRPAELHRRSCPSPDSSRPSAGPPTSPSSPSSAASCSAWRWRSCSTCASPGATCCAASCWCPWAMSPVAVGILWSWMFNGDYGTVQRAPVRPRPDPQIDPLAGRRHGGLQRWWRWSTSGTRRRWPRC